MAVGDVLQRTCRCGNAFLYEVKGRGRPPTRCLACRPRPSVRRMARRDSFEVTPAMRAYLAAFDAFLLAGIARRGVDEGRARARMHRHLHTMVADAGHDPDEFLTPSHAPHGPHYGRTAGAGSDSRAA